MGYRFDVFISYRRSEETSIWLQDHLIPLLRLHVRDELRRDVDVYWDNLLESGSAWPISLASALASSRILIPLWSGSYLSSRWCSTELDVMLRRQKSTSRAKLANPDGLIVPAVIHSAPLPPDLSRIQALDIVRGYSVRMARNSPGAEHLDNEIRKRAPGIARCIACAPPWKSAWERTAADAFERQLRRKVAPPKFGLPRLAA